MRDQRPATIDDISDFLATRPNLRDYLVHELEIHLGNEYRALRIAARRKRDVGFARSHVVQWPRISGTGMRSAKARITRSIFAAVRDIAQDSRHHQPLPTIGADPAQLRNRWMVAQERDQLDPQVIDVRRPIDAKLVGSRLHAVFEAGYEPRNVAGSRTRLLALQFLLGSNGLPISNVAANATAYDKQYAHHTRKPGRVLPEQRVPRYARHGF